TNYRLLANTIAHQWWGVSVSPASRDDWWLNDGFARYSEARYVENAAGEAGLEEVVKDMSVGALAYDTVPLSGVGKLDVFSPEFKTKYTVYRLGSNKGFRVVGEISQDLDLFRMPVELKIDTDGKTEDKRVEVVGTNSPFTVETFGKPRRIAVDPGDRVLKNSSDVKLRSSIMRGQGLVQQGDLAGALAEYNKALE